MNPRIAAFAGVGAVGFCVQMLTLALLTASCWSPALATAAAVEAAVVINFCLHERWTWRDRPTRREELPARLWRFHAANGFLSIAGNMALTIGAVGLFDLPVAAANLAAIGVMGAVNYWLADRWVFRPEARDRRRSPEIPPQPRPIG